MIQLYLSLLMALSLLGIDPPKEVTGLWQVSLVQMGDQEMTPNARWMRLHEDLSQESGNGGFQHSYGTYRWNQEEASLSFENTNGLKDDSGAFSVSWSGDKMIWKRMEEGQEVKVTLERIEKLPQTYGDRVLGMWMLEEAKGSGPLLEISAEESPKAFIFLRWDKKFVMGSANGKQYGVYNVHGHKAEIELIPYGDNCQRSFWKMDIQDKQIKMTLLNTEEEVSRTYKRIYAFPE